MKQVSPAKTATIDIDRATEFVGDDVDQISSLVDLGGVYENVLVFIPTITSAVVHLMLQNDADIDTVPVTLNVLDDDATGHFLLGTAAGTAAMAILFHCGAVQYFRVKAVANQAADRAFVCIGC